MSLLGDLFMLSPLFFFFACLVIAIAFRVFRRLRPAMKTKREQTLITEYIDDVYPYLGHERLEGWEDTDSSEAEGFESSALMDEEDEEE